MCHVITMFLKILHLYFLIQLGSSCLFKVDKHRGPWDDEAEERAVDDTCGMWIVEDSFLKNYAGIFCTKKFHFHN